MIPKLSFLGINKKTILYGAKPELDKLLKEPQGKTRFLPLINLAGEYDLDSLKKKIQ
jgi:hypothetical protein